jgi:hypothetical protein
VTKGILTGLAASFHLAFRAKMGRAPTDFYALDRAFAVATRLAVAPVHEGLELVVAIDALAISVVSQTRSSQLDGAAENNTYFFGQTFRLSFTEPPGRQLRMNASAEE